MIILIGFIKTVLYFLHDNFYKIFRLEMLDTIIMWSYVSNDVNEG